MRTGRLAALVCAVLLWPAAPARADVPDENADDAPPGTAMPLVCRRHPAPGPAPGSVLCDGFVLSRIPGDAAGIYDAALDVSLAVPPGAGPFPLLVRLHGYGLDKGGPGDDSQILSEGIAVLRPTARGFGESWGDVQLADEDIEIRDIQSLVRQVVEGTAFAVEPPFSLDRKRIAVTGVSYGAGQALLLAQSARRSWPCGPDTCQLVTAVPVAGWTDLIFALLPNGRPGMRYGDPGYVLGVEKLTYVSYLYGSGHRAGPRHGGSNYPPFLTRYYAFVTSGEPYQDPRTLAFVPHGAATAAEALRVLALDRSPLYQDYCAGRPLPILMVQAWTDDLFTAHEVVRFRDALAERCGGRYPLKVYLGNSGHPRAARADPAEQAFVLGMVLEWLRHHLLGRGPAPAFDVTSGVTHAPDESFDPGAVLRAAEVGGLARGRLVAEVQGPWRIVNPGLPATTDLRADPLVPEALSAARAGQAPGLLGALGPVEDTAGPLTGETAVFEVPGAVPAGEPQGTVCGMGTLRLRGTVDGTDAVYAARVWDLGPGPDGARVLVDRGVTRLLGEPGELDVTIPLHGNVWRVRAGHRLVVEVTNADSPYLRPDNLPSSTVIDVVTLDLPACEEGPVRVLAGDEPAPSGELPATGQAGWLLPLGLALLALAAAGAGLARPPG